MTKRKLLIICLMLIIILTGCNNKEDSEGSSFTAMVLEINDAFLLVEPVEGSVELKSADRIIVSVKDAKLFNSEDKEITIEEIEEGKQVEVFYTGGIAESYPAQINGCFKVRLLD